MDDSDDRTPWEDINPLMASAPTFAPPSVSLAPAAREDFARELTKCLSLVAPAGMDVSAREEWLAAAWEATRHLPVDLLRIGAAYARRTADHPSKIVPAIIAETDGLLSARRRERAEDRERAERNRPQLQRRRCTGEEAERILAEHGLLEAVRGRTAAKINRGPLRKPTHQDYIELGVDPAVLDAINPQPKDQA